MTDHQQNKELILNYFSEMESADAGGHLAATEKYTTDQYRFMGVYPFNELQGAKAVVDQVWQPLYQSLSSLQRRQDVFIAGSSEIDGDDWVMSMGHFMGLFDHAWLGIPPTRKMAMLRYAEFHCIREGRITRSGFWCDIIGLMHQAGVYPLPPETGHWFVYPGPLTHDGLQFEAQDPAEGVTTLALLNRMVEDLSVLNKTGNDRCPPELLAKTWRDDMIWYGPAGIGATYTIPRYQQQHQYPFREGLKDKVFNGHVCRFAEGNYACFFGWPNLTNTAVGGFLGLPGNNTRADMRVVDVYRREGDKLAENWVLIDLPWWLKQQGLDILDRTASIVHRQAT
jgi:hypothetical protein